LKPSHTIISEKEPWPTFKNRPASILVYLIALLMVLSSANLLFAKDLKGIVINGTTGKAAVGNEVMLLSLSNEGMNETASTRTDNAGRFVFHFAHPAETYVVRVLHQGVPYHTVNGPDGKTIRIQVYDVVEKLDGVSAIVDVERLEATNETLEIKQLVTIRNQSRPARTLMNDRAFEVQLPSDAHVESGMIQIEDGQPLKQKPVPGEQKGQYYFVSPIRPGDTRFAVVYRLPYNGSALIEPQVQNPLERFVVMLPKSMKFEPRTTGIFQPMPGTTPDNVLGTAPVKPNQTVAFHISGTGSLQELEGRKQPTPPEPKVRPGGGLGPPIDAPAPFYENRWPILASLGVLMMLGSVFAVMVRPKMLPANTSGSVDFRLPNRPGKAQRANRRSGSHRTRVGV
jgi:hypothetical protein